MCTLTTSPIQSGTDFEVTVGFTSTALVVVLTCAVWLTSSVVSEQATAKKTADKNKAEKLLFLFRKEINLNTRQG